ncbi:TetR/AcrR family transcriptional regulator [Kitasatospora sp. NPDC057223]|uniref:TetR/AcrR family transcriptional regulator n=1 Tax=Kitasatospora sp. NPDC057223 TaxID=3346055 RepID=UPI00363B5F46
MTGEEPPAARGQRADAQRNHGRILEAARAVVEEQGTQASLRDVARRADVGLGTLYRHFPTRDALLEALLRDRFDQLAARADELRGSLLPEAALAEWLRGFTLGTGTYRGLAASLMATVDEPESALHASCTAMHEAAGRLLEHAQDAGTVRPDVDGTDLFAMVNALGWITGQSPSMATRTEHLLDLFMDGLRTGGPEAATPDPAAP